jgi:hypothetical protein
MTGHFLFAHCDWLQVLFEQGIIGFMFAVFLVLSAARAAAESHRYWIIASLAAYSITCMGNSPMHFPVPAFFGSFLLAIAFGRSSNAFSPREKSSNGA